jgi:probable F420-dependent oxidoreductase
MSETGSGGAARGIAVGLPVANQLYRSDELHRVVDLARMADDAGVATVVVVDHVVMGRRLDRYLWGPFRFPSESPWLEPLTTLAAMAAATSKVRLATGILIAPLRPAALLAKTVATLDVLSRGRLDLGVGTGWQAEEYEAEGLDFDARGAALTDTIAACRALWSQSPAEFRSDTVSFSDIWCEPKPVRPGGPPVLFAGTLNGRNLRRVTTLGDGWIPIMNATQEEVSSGCARLRDSFSAAKRDPSTIKVRAPLPLVAGRDGRPDLDATLAGAGEWIESGVTEPAVPMAAFVRSHDEAADWFARLAKSWASATG